MTISTTSSGYVQITYSPDDVPMGYEYEIDTHPIGVHHSSVYRYYKLPKHFDALYEDLGGRNGLELKSPVGPLSYHKTVLHRLPTKDFNDFPSGRKNQGGIHVNVSKTDANIAHHKKVFRFLHDKANCESLLKLSGRSKNNFDHWSSQYSNKTLWNIYYGIITTRKYYAYELRMYHAQPSLILPALETADSLFRLARESDRITPETWMNYLKGKKKYRELSMRMKECGLS